MTPQSKKTALLEISFDGTIMIVKPVGPNVGQREAPIMKADIDPVVKSAGKAMKFMVMDLSSVQFMSSMGLGIERIAADDGGKDHVFIHALPAGCELLAPTARAHVRACVEVDAHRRMREDHAALVAALGDEPRVCRRDAALRQHQALADLPVRRHVRHMLGHLLGADGIAHVAAVEEHAGRIHREVEVDHAPARGPVDGLVILRGHAQRERVQREGAVHRAGVEHVQSESGGQRRRDRTLARPGGAVDRDDDPVDHSSSPPTAATGSSSSSASRSASSSVSMATAFSMGATGSAEPT